MSWQQAKRRNRGWRSGCVQWVRFGPLALSALACVSTELDALAPFPICSSAGTEGGGSGAVVQVVTQHSGTVLLCSGVAIAPRLVLTALGCVVEANNPLESDPVENVELVAGPDFGDRGLARVADYSAICDAEDGWALLERGDFRGRPGELVPPESITVAYRLPGSADPFAADSYQAVKASKVFTARSASRCRDDISVLQLEEPLGVEHVNLWLGDGGAVGEHVTLTNLCSAANGLSVVDEAPSDVLAITQDASQPTLPPRSMLLSGQRTSDALGGAVFRAPGHSLVGMIVSGANARCDMQTSEGTTFATHLTSYRALLLDAASATDEILRLDPDAHDPYLRDVSDCSGP
jgi:hypothetical protein